MKPYYKRPKSGDPIISLNVENGDKEPKICIVILLTILFLILLIFLLTLLCFLRLS